MHGSVCRDAVGNDSDHAEYICDLSTEFRSVQMMLSQFGREFRIQSYFYRVPVWHRASADKLAGCKFVRRQGADKLAPCKFVRRRGGDKLAPCKFVRPPLSDKLAPCKFVRPLPSDKVAPCKFVRPLQSDTLLYRHSLSARRTVKSRAAAPRFAHRLSAFQRPSLPVGLRPTQCLRHRTLSTS